MEDKLFWRYESGLKYRESLLGSIPTADGEIFAMRKSLWKNIEKRIINDDSAITLNILKQQKRVIYEPEAITNEEASHSLKDDFNVKARMVYGGVQILRNFNQQFKTHFYHALPFSFLYTKPLDISCGYYYCQFS